MTAQDQASAAAASDVGPSETQLPDLDAATQDILKLVQDSPFDLHTLIESALNDSLEHKSLQRSLFLTHAPTFLSLHDSLAHSVSSLDSLSTFLSTFSNDLGSVSHQIATLKEKSIRIEHELTAKRQLEEPLDRLLNGSGDGGIVIDPEVVAKIFDGQVDQSWKDAIAHLEKRIEATRKPLDQLASSSRLMPRSRSRRDSVKSANGAASPSPTTPDEDENTYKALVEARQVAEACKVMAASKIRPYLIAPFSLLKKSVTTNLQIVQTSVLLPHHAPLYGFLARQMPRVAIDVQRAYVSAARLYFETGFRRYARSLNQISKRGYAEDAGASGNIADVGASGVGGLLGVGGSSSTTSGKDAWTTSSDRLQYASFEGPGVTLAYQADDSKFQAPPEALFRSLTLVFFDNACSEYTFLVRYFEATPTSKRRRRPADHGSVLSPGSSVPPTPISELSEGEASGDVTLGEDGEGPTPSDSVSVVAAGVDPGANGTDDKEGDLVQLSTSERYSLKGRGGSSELFKKIFEPVINTWLNYSRSLLSPAYATLPLLPLLSMIMLTDQLLHLASVRGVEEVMMGPLLQFKMEAWPLFQKRFQEEIDSVNRAAGGAGGESGSVGDWMKSAIGSVGRGSGVTVSEEGLATIGTRYATLYSQIAHLTSGATSEDSSSTMLFSSLLRLRTAIERLVEKKVIKEGGSAKGKTLRATFARTVVRALDDGMASGALNRVQTERSHWDELSRR